MTTTYTPRWAELMIDEALFYIQETPVALPVDDDGSYDERDWEAIIAHIFEKHAREAGEVEEDEDVHCEVEVREDHAVARYHWWDVGSEDDDIGAAGHADIILSLSKEKPPCLLTFDELDEESQKLELELAGIKAEAARRREAAAVEKSKSMSLFPSITEEV